MLSEKFVFLFEGSTIDLKNYDIHINISGDADMIGRMLAEQAAFDYKNNQREMLRILLAAIHNLRRVMPGIEIQENGIIKPF